mmetsp:Transcript_32114/g.68498  ORF Transcript_32114/g.68498 Transcript_32114/m.68498 type:complete len:98 (-) Transcript_32114:568-861(-)
MAKTDAADVGGSAAAATTIEIPSTIAITATTATAGRAAAAASIDADMSPICTAPQGWVASYGPQTSEAVVSSKAGYPSGSWVNISGTIHLGTAAGGG